MQYSKEHEWVKMENNFVIIGVTDYAQKMLTDVVFVELPQVGQEVIKRGNLAIVESVKSVSDIFSPVTGEVIEVNHVLETNPGLINSHAENDGWIAKIKMQNFCNTIYSRFNKREI